MALPPPPGSSAVSSRKDGLSSGSGTQTCGGSRTSGCGQVPAALPSPPQSFAARTHRGRRRGSAGGAAERGVSDAETTAVFSVPRGLEAETSLVSQAFSNLPSDLGKLLET